MARLIDADERMQWLENNTDEKDWLVSQYNADWIWTMLDSAPTVDAVPVVHGRCDYCQDGKSFIGQTIMLANDGKCHTIRYCPNCGATMDLEVKDA